MKERLETLTTLLAEMQEIISKENLSWEMKYDLIFSDKGSIIVYDLMPEEFSRSLYIPDTSYEEDTRAFVAGFANFMVHGYC